MTEPGRASDAKTPVRTRTLDLSEVFGFAKSVRKCTVVSGAILIDILAATAIMRG